MSAPFGSVVDAHFDIVDPRFPLVPNRGYLPPASPAAHYRRRVAVLGIDAGVVVKATGFGRVTVADPDALMAAIVRVRPTGLIFGTDLPSTRVDVPFTDDDLARVAAAVATVDPGLITAVLGENARRLYRLGAPA